MAHASPMVRVGLGLHPQLAGTHSSELGIFEKYLPETRYVAEVGLDAGPAHYRTYSQQKSMFETILRLCATAGGKIFSIHAVRSVKDVLSLLETHLGGTNNRVVLHWFTGTPSEARRAAELGYYFSINGAMLAKTTVGALLTAIPKHRLLTETDGPFTKVGSRPSVPADVADTLNKLASLLGLQVDETRALLCANLTTLESPDICG